MNNYPDLIRDEKDVLREQLHQYEVEMARLQGENKILRELLIAKGLLK